MMQYWRNIKETIITAMWQERTAVTTEIADQCRSAIRSMTRSLPNAQVDECRREFARRTASKTGSPVLVFSDRRGGTMRMDIDAARSVVRRGVGGPRAERDLVVLLAAFCLLSLMRDELTSRASQVYYGALKNEVAVQFKTGSLGQRWVARVKADCLQGGHAEAQTMHDLGRDLTAATKALDEAVMMQFGVRKAECIGIHLGSALRGAAYRN